MKAGVVAAVAGAMALAWAGGDAALGQSVPPDTPADWLKKPRPEDLLAVWPKKSTKSGKGGSAIISCMVSTQGVLYDCTVVSEKPVGGGFGDAAIAVTPQLLMKPATHAGRPVVSSIKIPVNFPSFMPPDYVSTVTVLSNITWVDAPSYAEVVAAYPDKARTKGLSGRATLDCVFAKDGRVKDCRALQQQPSGAGFGRAAILLSSRFKGPDLLPEGRVTRGMHVQIPFVFSIEMLDPSKRVVGTPYWVALPDLSQVMSIFPKAALQAGVQDGRAALDCEVLVAGKVGGCAVVREFPRNLGFGDAVLALTPTFQLSVWTDEGLPTVGGRAVIPVRFKSPDTAEPPKP